MPTAVCTIIGDIACQERIFNRDCIGSISKYPTTQRTITWVQRHIL
jgi:hypothetical protein